MQKVLVLVIIDVVAYVSTERGSIVLVAIVITGNVFLQDIIIKEKNLTKVLIFIRVSLCSVISGS